MLKLKFLVTLAALMFLTSGISSVSAQTIDQSLSGGPTARPFGSQGEDILDTGIYEYDAQLWAPYDVTTMDGSTDDFKTGLYATFDFVYMNTSSPQFVSGGDRRDFEHSSDWSWGRELEIGFYGTRDSGWGLSWTDWDSATFINDGSFIFTDPARRFTDIVFHKASYTDVAVNKQFRQMLSTGGHIEPYIGARYMHLREYTLQNPIGIERTQRVSNSAVGLHLGSNYHRSYGRVAIGGNLGLAGLYNNQRYEASSVIPAGGFVNSTTNRDSEFTPVLDLGAELSYSLTRDISFRVGAELHYLWSGVVRVDTRRDSVNPYFGPGFNIPASIESQDTVVSGLSFGIDWRR